MPKRRRSSGRDGGRAANHPRKKRLYLVFDDWLWGYSIRKVDLYADADESKATQLPSKSNVHGDDVPRPPPAAFRLAGWVGYSGSVAAAFGTKILVVHPTLFDFGSHPPVPSCVVPVLDVHTRCLRYGPQPEVLQQQPGGGGGGGQRWRRWEKLRMPPFNPRHVASYAVHPDGRTIFVSTSVDERTFTFDSSQEAKFRWKRNGKWRLPFAGRAHFDGRLDAWVGLSGDPSTAGHLCASDVADVPSSSSSSRHGRRCPAFKISKEKLFGDDPAEKHVGATLVYIGGGSRSDFCLVQCICVEEDDGMDPDRMIYVQNKEDLERPFRFLVRLTTFSLKYDKNGDLTIGSSGRVRCFRAPKGCSEFSLNAPVAFWM
ncbi:hypothetical protein ACP4OV_007679 [Aristida adscensionis]